MKKLLDWYFDKKKEDNSYTLKKMGEELGITPVYLKRIMRGKYIPSNKVLFQIETLTNGSVVALEVIKEKQRKNETVRQTKEGER